jgi:hypothetical protein
MVTGSLVFAHSPSETVTLYVPAVLTVMDCVVAPLDQSQEPPGEAVSVTEPDAQSVVDDALMVASGNGFTVTAVGVLVDAKQPLAFVTVTLYEPLVVTSMDCVVAPVDQT